MCMYSLEEMAARQKRQVKKMVEVRDKTMSSRGLFKVSGVSLIAHANTFYMHNYLTFRKMLSDDNLITFFVSKKSMVCYHFHFEFMI